MWARRFCALLCAASFLSAVVLPAFAQRPPLYEDRGGYEDSANGDAEDAVRLDPSLPLEERERHLTEALDTGITLHAVEMPLHDLLWRIGAQLEVNLVLDHPAIEECGATPDVAVTWQLGRLPARTVLDVVLGEHGLTWTVRNGVLVVTSLEKAETIVETTVYDVADLVVQQNEFGETVADFEPLIAAITGTLQPQSWDEVGGAGSILTLESHGLKALVVAQTFRMHERIAALLADLRAVRREVDDLPEREDAPTGTAAHRVSPDKALVNGPYADAVEANNRFAFDLYAALARQSEGNVFVSPPNVATPLAMACAGADGRTADELLAALGFDGAQEELLAAYGALHGASAPSPESPWTLHAANRVWVDRGFQLRPDFASSLQSAFGAEPAAMDFADAAAASRLINAWVHRETRGMIRDILSSGDLETMPEGVPLLIATSALYFEGRWEKPFSEALTSLARFRRRDEHPSSEAKVWMMTQRDTFRYGAVDGARVVELPYEGGDLSFIAVLPREMGDPLESLKTLEQRLSVATVDAWRARLTKRKIELFLPRFEIESAFDLEEPLRQLGVETAFSPLDADFSRMSESETWLQFVRHMARIELNELGTKAAAATATGFFGGAPPKVPVFRADRPFVFLIRDNRTGSILFLGRLVDPPPLVRDDTAVPQ